MVVQSHDVPEEGIWRYLQLLELFCMKWLLPALKPATVGLQAQDFEWPLPRPTQLLDRQFVTLQLLFKIPTR